MTTDFVINPRINKNRFQTRFDSVYGQVRDLAMLAERRCDADVCCTEVENLEDIIEKLDELKQHLAAECNDEPFD